VRHNVKVVTVLANNGIWGLEKHPMEAIFGYSAACELGRDTRYDQVAMALGAHGEFVERPDDLRGALERAFAADKPALVNILTDPNIAYPRQTALV
jgi:acetolactate synthase-1/2/3 large subunit